VKKALDRAAELEIDSVQLFVQSPRAWRFPDHDPKDLRAFADRRQELGLGGVLVHSLYLVNLASPNEDFYAKSVETMRSTVDAACAIGADGVVFHVGSHQGAGFEAGLERVVPALKQVVERCSEKTWLLLENSAGAGGTIGRSIEELATLFDALERHPRLGVCLDSCHLWVSGFDVTDRDALDALLDELDEQIGLDRLRALHVNDAQAPLGSNRDRHANMLDGLMGEKLGVFLGHPKLQGLPAVLEVPGPDNHGADRNEVRKLRELHARWASSGSGRRPGRSGGRGGVRKTRD
jgi:deoxyribonuclease-4